VPGHEIGREANGTNGLHDPPFQRKYRLRPAFITLGGVVEKWRHQRLKNVQGTIPARGEPRRWTARPKRRTMVDMLRMLPTRAYLALRDREEGQAMVEYALLLFLIAVVSIAILTLLGTKVSSLFNEIVTDI